ncbi:glycosyltransferase, partial [bacterium]
KKLEENVLYKSSKIIVISREQKERLLKNYNLLKHNDISIVTHGYDKSDFLGITPKIDKNKFVITHSGLFQDNRNPKPFFVAFKKLLDSNANSNIQLKLVGLMRKNHLRMIKKLKLEENVILTGNVSHKEAVEHLLDSDVLWILQNDDVRTPGKLYEYFGAKKPIIVTIPKSSMRELALSSGIAMAADPNDSKDILQVLNAYYELWKKNSLPKGNNEFVEEFDRRNLTEKLSQILSSSSII